MILFFRFISHCKLFKILTESRSWLLAFHILKHIRSWGWIATIIGKDGRCFLPVSFHPITTSSTKLPARITLKAKAKRINERQNETKEMKRPPDKKPIYSLLFSVFNGISEVRERFRGEENTCAQKQPASSGTKLRVCYGACKTWKEKKTSDERKRETAIYYEIWRRNYQAVGERRRHLRRGAH